MSIYNEEQALEYERIINQTVYKYYVDKKLQMIKKWINKESVLLDVGCGTGAYTTSLAKNCKIIIGIDISPKMVERGHSKAKQTGLSNTYFLVADVANLPFDKGIFDLVFSVNLFHHVANKNIIAKGLFRCIKQQGHILVFELNPNSLGWSKDLIPIIIRGFVYLVLFPFRQQVIDNVEEGTEMISISELLDRIKGTKIVLTKVGGFIPTYCPKFLFNIFILLEKVMESTPLLRRYGAHILLVGEVH